MMNTRALAVLATTACLVSHVLGDDEVCGNLSGEDVFCPQGSMAVCEGDTRGDQKCNHDPTHRVCAKIGDPDTSFFGFTGQADIGKGTPGWHGNGWCGTAGSYNPLSSNPHGHDVRCPEDNPTWCICKWATASWIKGETCNEAIDIDCAASDICSTSLGLFFSYNDGGVDLGPAKECVPTKCPQVWEECCTANPSYCEDTTDNLPLTEFSASVDGESDTVSGGSDGDSSTVNVAIAVTACVAALAVAIALAYVFVIGRSNVGKGATSSTEMENL